MFFAFLFLKSESRFAAAFGAGKISSSGANELLLRGDPLPEFSFVRQIRFLERSPEIGCQAEGSAAASARRKRQSGGRHCSHHPRRAAGNPPSKCPKKEPRQPKAGKP